MNDNRMDETARVAAEEILRIIYGDDLEGCTVSLDRITEIISTAMAGQTQIGRAVAELNEKAYEAIRLLSTPPADGPSLNPEELRTLLGERLDKIQSLATKVIAATKAPENPGPSSNENTDSNLA
ncbi:MAG: hypothetical protein QOF24_2902 [Verrucomicrobiota bacterium]|jgi:hypothetical protein